MTKLEVRGRQMGGENRGRWETKVERGMKRERT